MEEDSGIELILKIPVCPEHKIFLEPKKLQVGEGKDLFNIPFVYYCKDCNGYYVSDGRIIKDPLTAAEEYCKNIPGRAMDILKKAGKFQFS